MVELQCLEELFVLVLQSGKPSFRENIVDILFLYLTWESTEMLHAQSTIYFQKVYAVTFSARFVSACFPMEFMAALALCGSVLIVKLCV